MPPSGFSQKAINGLLKFVESNYQTIARDYNGKLTEKEFLEETSNKLESQVISFDESMNGISKEGMQGLTTFVVECYRDLAKEISNGKDKYSRPVIDGKAIQKELNQIGDYLKEFTI